MSNIADMLLNRRKELHAKMQEEVRRAVTPFMPELKEIETALAAIGFKGHQPELPNMPPPQKKKRAKLSTNDQILEILEKHVDGLPTAKIAEALKKDYVKVLENKAVSWYLSSLKRAGKLILVGGEIWKKV
jgi:hypothetical protein